jgi:pimeloyl-ACP methyl ester carboxylesterase
MAILDRNGLRLHYSIHGVANAEAPVLLTHGFAASERMWDANLAALSADRRVLTWDMRGHARSDAPEAPADYGVEQSIGDLLALLDALGASRAVLAGMSLGGYLSLAFHARHPERVAALILLDTGPGFRREEPRAQWNAGVERTAATLERDGLAALPSSPEIGEHPNARGLVNVARRVMAQHDGHVAESLRDIAVPTLVVVGSADTNFLRSADYMAARIPGARKVVLEGAGHAANIDAAERFNGAVREFLENL